MLNSSDSDSVKHSYDVNYAVMFPDEWFKTVGGMVDTSCGMTDCRFQ